MNSNLNRILTLSIAIILSACATKNAEAEKAAPQLPKSAKSALPAHTLTMSQLNGAANLLMAAADSGVNTSCNITPEQAMAWINPLHSMIDEQAAREAEAALKNPKAWAAQNKLDSCEKRCECGMWASVLEGAPKAMPKGKREVLQKKAAKQSPEMLRACAEKQADWFCGSELKGMLVEAVRK